ncbi:MAG: hypothetical protein ACEPO8_01855 [Rhodothermaceae bacterium]
MKLHKEDTSKYEPFYKFVENEKENNNRSTNLRVASFNTLVNDSQSSEKHSHLFFTLINFEREIKRADNPSKVIEVFERAVRRIIPIKEAVIMNFKNSDHSLIPVAEVKNKLIVERLDHYNKEGVLSLAFDGKTAVVIPELSTLNGEGAKLNYILYPIFDDNNKKGLCAILTSLSHENFSEIDEEFIEILLSKAVQKLDKTNYKSKLNTAIEELQVYQAKLSNDFRLSAIGELTDGILEDIMTPLQVIMSYTDMIDQESENSYEVKKIKTQITKINSTIGRLVKFINLNQKDNKIKPCNINEVINDYCTLVKSTIDSLNLELVQDFEQDIPSILSHPNYIYQIFTNIIGLIKNKINGDGGIIIQTRFIDDNIIVKLISTANLQHYASNIPTKKTGKTIDLNTRIVENLMKKHEGKVSIEAYSEAGSTVSLYFPLIRKIRK